MPARITGSRASSPAEEIFWSATACRRFHYRTVANDDKFYSCIQRQEELSTSEKQSMELEEGSCVTGTKEIFGYSQLISLKSDGKPSHSI